MAAVPELHTLIVNGERRTRRGVRRWLACPVPGCGTRAVLTISPPEAADGFTAAAAEAHQQTQQNVEVRGHGS